MTKVTVEICQAFYHTKDGRFRIDCGRKGAILKPEPFAKWLENKKKINTSIVIALGVK